MLSIKTKQKSNIKQGLTKNNRQPSKFASQKAKKKDLGIASQSQIWSERQDSEPFFARKIAIFLLFSVAQNDPFLAKRRGSSSVNSDKTTEEEANLLFCGLVRVFITDFILRHSAEAVETYSQSTKNACVYKEFCNTKGI